MTSPNGVLLFREASKTITTYGEHLLALTDIPQDKIYPLKYPYHTVTLSARVLLFGIEHFNIH